jgi:hypothetical protein
LLLDFDLLGIERLGILPRAAISHPESGAGLPDRHQWAGGCGAVALSLAGCAKWRYRREALQACIDFEGNVLLAGRRFFRMERQPSAIMVEGRGASGFLDAQGRWLLRDTSSHFHSVMARDGWLWYSRNYRFYCGKAILSDSTLGPINFDRALDTTITAFCRRFPQYAQANAALVTVSSKLVIWDDGTTYKLLLTDGDWIYTGTGGHNALTGHLDEGLVFLNSSKGMAMLDQDGKILIPFLGQSLAPWGNMVKATRWDGKKYYIGLYDRRGWLVMDFVEQ